MAASGRCITEDKAFSMLFDVIPDNFFIPLSSPNKRVYWECLSEVFSVTGKQLSFGVERDVLTDRLEYYFDRNLAADFVAGEEENGFLEEKKTSRDKANFIIRSFEHYGWIYIDTDMNYVQRVNFRDCAIAIMKTLLDIENEKKAEYQGYIYTIYSLSQNLTKNGAEGQCLLEIEKNTDSLVTGLKSLNANIKHYLDDLTRHQTVKEIMQALLDDYYTNVVDKAYHRLLTSDNVSKFRPAIMEKLESAGRYVHFVNAAAKQIGEIRELQEKEAREEVLEILHNVMEAFRQMDAILDEINKKNSRYQRAAINRAKFLLTDSEDLRGQLRDIICILNERVQELGRDYNAIYELEETEKLVRIFSWEYLDMDSLYSPVEGKKEFNPKELEETEPDLFMRKEKYRQMLLRMQQILSPKRIDEYVGEILKEKESICASELDLEKDDTFIRLIYIRLYGQRKEMMHYRIRLLDRVSISGYRFRDFVIERK